MCVADSSVSRNRSQVGSSVNPNLKRCPFTWQCPVNSSTTHLNCSLFNVNRSFVLLAEGSSISLFACLSPVTDSQCFICDFSSSSPWPLSWQLHLRCRKLVQVILTNVQILFLPTDLPFHYQQYNHDLAPIWVELCYALYVTCLRSLKFTYVTFIRFTSYVTRKHGVFITILAG
jgi:hypothetical protein